MYLSLFLVSYFYQRPSCPVIFPLAIYFISVSSALPFPLKCYVPVAKYTCLFHAWWTLNLLVWIPFGSKFVNFCGFHASPAVPLILLPLSHSLKILPSTRLCLPPHPLAEALGAGDFIVHHKVAHFLPH